MKYDDFRSPEELQRRRSCWRCPTGRSSSDARRRAFKVRLPAPPMLMIDRILEIRRDGARGRIVAERDVNLDDWFFQCHFLRRPGAAGLPRRRRRLAAARLLLRLVRRTRLRACAGLRRGRVLRPDPPPRQGRPLRDRRSPLHRSSPMSGASMVIGDASLLVDDEPIYTRQTRQGGDLPAHRLRRLPESFSERSRGGKMER